jgi:hypothetical protein
MLRLPSLRSLAPILRGSKLASPTQKANLAMTADIAERLRARMQAVQEWIADEAPYVAVDQRHLDANTPERSMIPLSQCNCPCHHDPSIVHCVPCCDADSELAFEAVTSFLRIGRWLTLASPPSGEGSSPDIQDGHSKENQALDASDINSEARRRKSI